MHGGGPGFEPPRLHPGPAPPCRGHLDNQPRGAAEAPRPRRRPAPEGAARPRAHRTTLFSRNEGTRDPRTRARRAPAWSGGAARAGRPLRAGERRGRACGPGPGGPAGGGREEGRTVDALASAADEGRGHAAKRPGEALAAWDPGVSEWGNPPGARPGTAPAGARGAPGELKHLSTPRRREDSPSSGERTGRSPNRRGGTGCRRCRGGVGRATGAPRQGGRPGSPRRSRRLLERAAGAGESPVGDASGGGVPSLREYRRTRGIRREAGPTTAQG